MTVIVRRPDDYGSAPRTTKCYACPNDAAWIVRPMSPAFVAPERPTCGFHLEETVEELGA